MRFSAFVAALLPVGAALAQTTHTVLVGPNGTLTYSPTSITAAQGDMILFQFETKNHTVTQSTFAAPCSNITGTPIDSGFQPVAAGSAQVMQFNFTLQNASAPLWFYCRQTGHCGQGMVFAINPTANKSFDAFQTAAKSFGASAGSSSAGAKATGSSSSSAPASSSSTNGAGAARLGRAAGVLAALGAVAGVLL
ncbi:Cupredoxin [Amylocystis lapponica]|nr:Cupredoxin [Amylocystis lapponica]